MRSVLSSHCESHIVQVLVEGGNHQLDDVAQFREAHVYKQSGICCCVHDTLMNIHLYMHLYTFYIKTLNLSRY